MSLGWRVSALLEDKLSKGIVFIVIGPKNKMTLEVGEATFQALGRTISRIVTS